MSRTTHDWDGRRLPGRGAVVYDEREPDRRDCCREGGRCLHHVTGVFEEQETGEVYVRVEDGTHTTLQWVHGDDFWDLFSPAGWSVTGTKPTYLLTRQHSVEDHHDLMTDGGRPTVDDPETRTVECWRCGKQRYEFESCHHCGGSCKPHTKKKQMQEGVR